MITENLSTLKINKLSKEQYEREFAAGRVIRNEFYLVPDEEIDLSKYMTVTNPVGIGSFSMNRANNSAVGNYSHAKEERLQLQSLF